MPFMERITWSGVALHEGVNLGHPASHGCIRMSHDFAMRLWALTRLGVGVVIARPELRPEEISDSHLFVHKTRKSRRMRSRRRRWRRQGRIPPAAARAEFLKTAETVESGKTTDTLRETARNSGVDPADPDRRVDSADRRTGNSARIDPAEAATEKSYRCRRPKPGELDHSR